MKIVHTIADLRAAIGGPQRAAFVPTMGNLHEGHLALVRQAKGLARAGEPVVASIFVNRLQFAPHEDFDRYPRTFEADRLKLEKEGVDVLFAPAVSELYPDGFDTWVDPGKIATVLEGAFRPGHFRGVATVCLKLFHIVSPDVVYFGQKDAQQVEVIRRMLSDLDLPIALRVLPTVRDSDGLALSSRNARLSTAARTQAAEFPKILGGMIGTAEATAALEDAGFEVDYVEDRAGVRLGAVRLEGVRLIDNVAR